MKTCFKCQTEKPLTEFYKHPQMADGYLNKCKQCAKSDSKADYSAKRAIKSEYDRKRNQDPARRAKKRKYEKQYTERNPDKYKARYTLKNAIRDGRVKRMPCVHCGSNKAQGHHTDYSKPLEVVWACFKCHREREHGQTVTVT